MNIRRLASTWQSRFFQVHGTDERGKAVVSKVLRRSQ